ncbi:MAG: tryptophan 2,3-dioxygenase [Flavobacteriales bacterium]|jgi:tryptophan 2,3-dioxygenase|nr:tryptophan 2,3-dioxygenase [Flavobacteriales bacterium]MBT6174544.1 tryptophan 2,3-dioxygenase [Flavobacteriales bacterium]MBT7652394.1 tryptophan 2,3-dioxygenase [Flavobacteriales bacterium]
MPNTTDFKPEILEKLDLLQKKYSDMGQDLSSYLDGLLYADFLTYWDYINLDTLLNLQQPITPYPDEKVFIIYHQITELYFKLAIHEFDRVDEHVKSGNLTPKFLLERVRRINRYFEALTSSFDIMVDGMDQGEFLKFRMSLLPASGFQSAQYRKVEIYSTTLDRLSHKNHRDKFAGYSLKDIPLIFDHLYWREGASELKSGSKTLTLKQFEKKYDEGLKELAVKVFTSNIRAAADSLEFSDDKTDVKEDLRQAMRWLDVNVNINWTLVHYKSAVRYLQRNPADIAASGGTNWQKYLPPRFQKRIFFPELWSEQEIEDWGKSWVSREVFGVK